MKKSCSYPTSAADGAMLVLISLGHTGERHLVATRMVARGAGGSIAIKHGAGRPRRLPRAVRETLGAGVIHRWQAAHRLT